MGDTDDSRTRLETRKQVDTPEGVTFGITPAGPLVRLLAAGVDLVIRVIIYIGSVFLFIQLGNTGAGLFFITVFGLEWLYPVYFEGVHRGRTPGKMLFDLQVRNADGTPVGWNGALLRNFLRAADFAPFGYACGIAVMTATKDFQRLGDLAADTLVCYERSEGDREPDALPEAPVVRPPARLTREERAAIISYAERSRHWHSERNVELAETLEEVSGREGEAAVEWVRGVAKGVVERASGGLQGETRDGKSRRET